MNAAESSMTADRFIESLERQHGPPTYCHEAGVRVWEGAGRALLIASIGRRGGQLLLADSVSELENASIHELSGIVRTPTRGAFEVSLLSVSEPGRDALSLVDISLNAMRRRLTMQTLEKIERILI